MMLAVAVVGSVTLIKLLLDNGLVLLLAARLHHIKLKRGVTGIIAR